MELNPHVPITAGLSFEDGRDHGRILVFGRDTGGRYSMMEYVVAARPISDGEEEPAYGPHRHHEIEETFLVRAGRLRFLLGEDVIDLGPGDLVRVPKARRTRPDINSLTYLTRTAANPTTTMSKASR